MKLYLFSAKGGPIQLYYIVATHIGEAWDYFEDVADPIDMSNWDVTEFEIKPGLIDKYEE